MIEVLQTLIIRGRIYKVYLEYGERLRARARFNRIKPGNSHPMANFPAILIKRLAEAGIPAQLHLAAGTEFIADLWDEAPLQGEIIVGIGA